jgi:hypothetical protein
MGGGRVEGGLGFGTFRAGEDELVMDGRSPKPKGGKAQGEE